MNIVHVLLSLDPDYGGPASSVQSLAVAQAALGHRVDVLVPEVPGTTDHIDLAYSRFPSLRRVGVHQIGFTPIQMVAAMVRRRACSLSYVAEADFVHLHDLWQPFLAQAAYAAYDVHVPYAVAPHGTLNSWSLRQKATKKRAAMQLVWRQILERAAFLHLLSETEAQEIARLDLKASVVIAGNGAFLIPPNELPKLGTFRSAFGLSSKRPFVLFLGRLHPNKGLDVLIEAFSGLARVNSDLDLVIAGPDEGALDAAQAQVKRARLLNRVTFVGPIYGTDKTAALVDAEIFCLPSRGEAFSMAVVEAMAVGSAILISEQCNFPEVAANDAGVVCRLDANELAEKILALHSNPLWRADLGKKAQALVQERYTWESVATKLVTAYERARQQQTTAGAI